MSARVAVKARASDKQSWIEAARREGLPLSRWVTRALMRRAQTEEIGFRLTKIKNRRSPVANALRAMADIDARFLRNNRLHAVAIHEAGHAVAAVVFGFPIESVTIIPGPGYAGRVTFASSGWPVMEARLLKELIVDLAGYAAHHRFDKNALPYSIAVDYLNAVKRASEGSSDAAAAAAVLEYAASLAEKLVEIKWDDIRRLAKALLARDTLSGDQAIALLSP